MYYSSGNYEAFARPRIPEGANKRCAWLVGGGLASLASAVFMIRDAGIPGENITVLEKSPLPGGALDGIEEPERGFVIRGGREMEDHFECLWDCFRTIPSLEVDGASVLDEFYWLNKDDPNYSLRRVTEKRGHGTDTEGQFTLSAKARRELVKMILASRESLENKRINEFFSEDFLGSNFWLYWRTMFAFEEWHSALEMKLYLHRFMHHIGGLPDLSALKFTKYNQYESLVLPMMAWLGEQGVRFEYGCTVTDVDFDLDESHKRATRLHVEQDGATRTIDLGADNYVLMTIGSLVDNSDEGDQNTPAAVDRGPASAWDLWRTIARKDSAFGRPEVFSSDIDATKWQSATVTTLDDRIPAYIEKICGRDPRAGKVVTGGIVTVKDSSWLLSWTVNRQPHFKKQRPEQVVVWVYGLFSDKPGDYVKKTLSECTGREITAEWLYHLGVPTDQIDELAANAARCVPVMMPYVTSFFMPREAGDRPDVVPTGAENFAFIGQFAETGRDCIFTTEYSVRTAMEAVYQLFDVDRGVPETFGSTYDVRTLLAATAKLRDDRPLTGALPTWMRSRIDRLAGRNQVGKLLKESGLI